MYREWVGGRNWGEESGGVEGWRGGGVIPDLNLVGMRSKKLLQHIECSYSYIHRVAKSMEYRIPAPNPGPVNRPRIVISDCPGFVLSPVGQAPIPCDAKTRLTALEPRWSALPWTYFGVPLISALDYPNLKEIYCRIRLPLQSTRITIIRCK